MWQTTIAALLTLSMGTTAPTDPGPAIPEPTGQLAVGTTALHLVDHERPDPWDPAKPYRELMVSIWYPARPGGAPATYLEPAAAADTASALGLPADSTALDEVRVPARAGAPARGGAHPVLLFSPGHLASRAINTTLVTDLASHGYVVVTIDHTHESIVDFPGGRVAPRLVRLPDPESPEFEQQIIEFNRDTIAARVADTGTVLDALARLAGGTNPDAERRRLPSGLGDALDLSRVGMFGHSAGGATTAEAMYADDRVDAGAVVDSGLGYDLAGEVLPPVARHGLDRPVLLLSSEQANLTHVSDPSIASFWANQRGWKRDLQLAGANHVSFADHEALLPQLVATGAVYPAPGQTPQEFLTDWLGQVPPADAIRSTRAYLRAFFDTHLRHRDTGLFDGPSCAHPHIRFIG